MVLAHVSRACRELTQTQNLDPDLLCSSCSNCPSVKGSHLFHCPGQKFGIPDSTVPLIPALTHPATGPAPPAFLILLDPIPSFVFPPSPPTGPCESRWCGLPAQVCPAPEPSGTEGLCRLPCRSCPRLHHW